MPHLGLMQRENKGLTPFSHTKVHSGGLYTHRQGIKWYRLHSPDDANLAQLVSHCRKE